MEKVVIIGASEFQNPLILKAKEMGYETHVFAWKAGDIGEKTADYFYPISIIEKDEILKKCQEIKPSAVVSIASDLAVSTINYLCNKLNLTSNDVASSLICTNKYKMREAFKKANIKIPKFTYVDAEGKIDITGFKFPIIIKPTDRSGSRGITKIDSCDSNILDAIKLSIENSFEKRAIIEEYIFGEEFSCECISFKGKHTCLAITKKYTTGAPNFIETGHLEPSGLDKNTRNMIKKEVYKALDALDIKYGASHTEFKINEDGEIRIIEIGARMGGDCIGSDLVEISTGYDFVKMVLEVGLGKKPSLEKVCEPKIALINFIFNEKDLKALEIIKKEYSECIHRISEISSFDHKIVDSSSRYGFYILSIKNKRDLNKIKKIVGVE